MTRTLLVPARSYVWYTIISINFLVFCPIAHRDVSLWGYLLWATSVFTLYTANVIATCAPKIRTYVCLLDFIVNGFQYAFKRVSNGRKRLPFQRFRTHVRYPLYKRHLKAWQTVWLSQNIARWNKTWFL